MLETPGGFSNCCLETDLGVRFLPRWQTIGFVGLILRTERQYVMTTLFLKRGLMLAAVLACSIISVSNASAAFTVSAGQTIKLSDGPGNVNAGEFIVKHQVDTYATEKFRTFCVQTNEFLSLGETLTVVAIADFSFSPANSIKSETSALYREFMRGMAIAGSTLNVAGTILGKAYTFNSTTPAGSSRAGELQQAIWRFQGQSGYGAVVNDFTTAAIALGFGGSAATSLLGTDLTTYGYVQAMQLLRSDGHTRAQDQLYWDGRGQIVVPEPASIALWGAFALGGVLLGRRRRNSTVVAG